jgi:proline-rich protein PRCC
MLPAPKQKVPVMPKPERVLGGGQGPGLVFNISRSAPGPPTLPVNAEDDSNDLEEDLVAGTINDASSTPKPATFMLPPSLRKGKANISLEESSMTPISLPKPVSSAPSVDFFSLGLSLHSHLFNIISDDAPFIGSTSNAASALIL